MKKDNKIIEDFSKITFLYHAWTDNFEFNYNQLIARRVLILKPIILNKIEPFFGDWNYFDDLDMNDNRPHWGLKALKNDTYADIYDFRDANFNAYSVLLRFWVKGFTFITYLHKLYIHFNLPFSSLEYTYIDFYFSMLSSMDELVLFIIENDENNMFVNKILHRSIYIEKIINNFINYHDFLNLLFAWSNQSLKYKDKWLNLSSEDKVKEVLQAELSLLSTYVLYLLHTKLPWTLEQHKTDLDIRQKDLHEAFNPILKNMQKLINNEAIDPSIPLLVPFNIHDILKK